MLLFGGMNHGYTHSNILVSTVAVPRIHFILIVLTRRLVPVASKAVMSSKSGKQVAHVLQLPSEAPLVLVLRRPWVEHVL
jgi:hypothetical protein